MKLKAIIAVAVLLVLPASSAFAQLPPVTTSTGSVSGSASSWLAGAQAGYNWQRGQFVYGLETDISATHLNTNLNLVLLNPLSASAVANANANIDWYGTVRGRVGWTQGPWLFYGTGGLAYGHADLSSSITGAPLALSSQTSSTRAGWVAGAGIDYMWSPNVILSLGYQYVDLGNLSLASSSTGVGASALTQSANAHVQFQVVTAGLSWRFYSSAPQSREGLYAGGHVGGAWGNDTNASYSFTPCGLLCQFSDVRLKRDVALVGRLDNGLGLYRFRYLWSDTVYVGVMAQEVALLYPDAVVRDAVDDYLRVNYGRLGLKLVTLSEWDARSRAERF
jgi:outer membrane immunogenic protein